MGLNEGGSNRTYLNISNGKIARRVKENDPEFKKAIPCSNKENTKSWNEVRYSSISGKITGIADRDTDWGKDLNVTIEDGGEVFQLQMPFSSRYASSFFMCLPNIDFSKKIIFNPWQKEVVGDGGVLTKKTALYLKYEGSEDNITWFWTKDAPGELPPLVKIKVKGKETWDDSDRQEFMLKYLKEVVAPKMGKAVVNSDEPQHIPDAHGGDPLPF